MKPTNRFSLPKLSLLGAAAAVFLGLQTYAADTTLFSDSLEDSRPATDPVQLLPFQGTKFVELFLIGSARPKLFASMDPSFVSDEGDEVSIEFAMRVDSGVASIYPRTGTYPTDVDTGQIGFFEDGRVGILDDEGANWQFLTQTHTPEVWNTVVIKTINGTGNWSVSVNDAEFESHTGMGSGGGVFGGNVTGFQVREDALPTLVYYDAFLLTNHTKETLMFADSFDDGTVGDPPLSSDPQVGTWSRIQADDHLIVHESIDTEVESPAPPNAPQVGSYTSATALVGDTGGVSGTNFIFLYNPLDQGDARPGFIAPVPQGTELHAEAWLYYRTGNVHFGLDTPDDDLFANVTLKEGGSITVFDGTNDVVTGLNYLVETWEKYQIDYVVGSDQLILTLSSEFQAEQSVTATVPVQNEVRGLWFSVGLPDDPVQSIGYVDDILARAPIVAPAHLDHSRNGNQLILSWVTPGFVLQENSDLTNAAGWTDLTGGGASPVSVTMDTGTKFFRLKQQP